MTRETVKDVHQVQGEPSNYTISTTNSPKPQIYSNYAVISYFHYQLIDADSFLNDDV